MVSIVAMYFGIFTYSMTATQKAETLESANKQLKTQLSSTPAVNQQAYTKSVAVFEKIRELKVEKKQDTAKLEELYAASVKNLSEQKGKEAEQQLKAIETEIEKIETSLVITPSPQPSGPAPSVTASPSPSVAPSPGDENEASASASVSDN